MICLVSSATVMTAPRKDLSRAAHKEAASDYVARPTKSPSAPKIRRYCRARIFVRPGARLERRRYKCVAQGRRESASRCCRYHPASRLRESKTASRRLCPSWPNGPREEQDGLPFGHALST